MGVVTSFLLHPGPLKVGSDAPPLSLTADDGTWLQSRDYLDRFHLVLVFFSDPTRSRAMLDALDAVRPEVEALDGRLYAVHHSRPETLRRIRDEIGLGFPVLYDMLAVTSRVYHQAGRRPYVRDGVVILGKDGRVCWHQQGAPSADQVIDALRQVAGGEQRDQVVPNGGTVDWPRADALLAANEPFVMLDVRTPDEFGAHHVPDAVNIPVDELPQRYEELKRKARVLTVCQTGGRSAAATSFLVSVGFTEVYNVRGGIAAWKGSGE